MRPPDAPTAREVTRLTAPGCPVLCTHAEQPVCPALCVEEMCLYGHTYVHVRINALLRSFLVFVSACAQVNATICAQEGVCVRAHVPGWVCLCECDGACTFKAVLLGFICVLCGHLLAGTYT